MATGWGGETWGSNAWGGNAVIPVSVVESAAFITTEIVGTAFSDAVNETLEVSAAEAAVATYAMTRAEALTITDAHLGAFPWEPVDDIQDANWQNINNPQSAAWTAVATQES